MRRARELAPNKTNLFTSLANKASEGCREIKEEGRKEEEALPP
jgi:hypothetical protein